MASLVDNCTISFSAFAFLSKFESMRDTYEFAPLSARVVPLTASFTHVALSIDEISFTNDEPLFA